MIVLDVIGVAFQVGKLQGSVLQADQQLRKEEQKAALTSSELEGKIAAAESHILKQTASLVESRTRDMQRRWNELEDSVYERLNARMSEESEKLSHVTKVRPPCPSSSLRLSRWESRLTHPPMFSFLPERDQGQAAPARACFGP